MPFDVRPSLRVLSSCLCLVALLSSCVVKPERPKPILGNEEGLTCTQLADAIDTAKRQQAAAEKEDTWQNYVVPPGGMISAYNVNKAKKAAKKRLDYLNSVAAGKGCYRGPDISNFIDDGAFRPTFDYSGLAAATKAYDRPHDVDFESIRYYRRKPSFTFGARRTAAPTAGFAFD